MAGQAKGKGESNDYHSDSESEAEDLFFTGVCRSERARQLLRLIAHLKQADCPGHAEVISKLKEKKVEVAWIHGLAQLTPESQTEEQWLKSWDRPKGNVTAWITNNIAKWSETMGEGDKKRLTDEGNLLMEESSRRALKQHAADNKDLPTHDDPPAEAIDELGGIFEMARLEEPVVTSADTASDQATEENDLSQADKFEERGIIKGILPQFYEKTEPSQHVAETGRPEDIVGAHEHSKRKDKSTTSLNQQDHELPPTTEVSETNEASRHLTPFTPEENREIERVWNGFQDYLARQDMLRSSLSRQDDQHSLLLESTRPAGEEITKQYIHSDPFLNPFADWFLQRKALRDRDERIARDRGYGVKWNREKASLFPLDRVVRRADRKKARTMGKKVRAKQAHIDTDVQARHHPQEHERVHQQTERHEEDGGYNRDPGFVRPRTGSNDAHGRSGLVNTTKGVAGGLNVVDLDLVGLDTSTKIHSIARVDMKTFSDNGPYRATDAAEIIALPAYYHKAVGCRRLYQKLFTNVPSVLVLDTGMLGSVLLDPIRQICISHLRLTSIQTAKPNNPTTCMSLLNLDVNKYPFNDPDKLCIPTTHEFHSANDAVVVATFKAFGKLDKEKYEEGWDAVISCAGVLMDLRARDVYLREILPTIQSEGTDGWKKTCDEWILKAKTGAQ
ncbi:hypothetical protein FVER53590_14020 [Fusarium verticillioides]|nr:hypothetical protein FVER53590_14020 [Fusarium verticillioides]